MSQLDPGGGAWSHFGVVIEPSTPPSAFDELLRALGEGTPERALAEAAREACERDRRAAQARADALSKEFEAFGALVSHDLRAPLRSIDGFSRALVEDHAGQLDAEGLRYLGFVRGSADRLGELIDTLLAIWRLALCDVSRVPIDLSTIARDAVRRHELAAPARKVDATVEEGLACEADPALIATLVEKLVDNAWKFTARRDHAHVTIGRVPADRGDGGPPAFFVRDDGAGFDPAFAGKLFGVFQRLHSTTEFEGIGAGLAMAQRIVARHGGRIWAEGVVDAGATVYFTLS